MRPWPVLLALSLFLTGLSPAALAADATPTVVNAISIRAGLDKVQAAMDRDDGVLANRLADQVLTLVRQSDLILLLPEAMLMKGESLMSLEKDGDARKYMLNALGLSAEFGDERVHANALNDLGIIQERAGNAHSAESYYEESYAIASTLDDAALFDAVSFDLGSIQCQRGNTDEGYPLLQKVLERARNRTDRYSEVKLLVRLADTERDMKQLDKAQASATEALALSRQIKHPASEQGALRVMALVDMDRDDAPAAEAHLKEAQGAAIASHDDWSVASAAFDLGAFYVARGRSVEAVTHLALAERTFHKLGRQELVEQIRQLLIRITPSKNL